MPHRTTRRPPALLLALAAILLGGTLGAPSGAQESAPAAAEVWYAERITAGDAPVRVEHLWSKGRRFRSEWVAGGTPVVTIVAGERYVMFDRITRTGVAIQRSPKALADDRRGGRPFANEIDTLKAEGGERVREETVAGRRCDIWRVTDSLGRREVCIASEEPRLPLFFTAWVRSSGREITSRYVEWTRSLELPDSFFAAPPDVTLETIGYEEYLERAPKERLGPFPPLHRELLHGTRE